MPNIIHKYKSDHMYFVTIKPEGDHNVYMSAYGKLAAGLLEKYAEDQRADNEELFAEWDKSIEQAASEVGFSSIHDLEDGHLYITSYQNGLGISDEEMAAQRKLTGKSGS